MIWIGVAVLAGICTGTFGLPMKFTTKWKWENTWSMWSIWTLLFVPWAIGFLTIPNLLEVYRQASWQDIGWVVLFGFIWSFSAVAFGTGIYYLGLALGYSLMMGLIISIGSLAPLITMHREKVFEASGLAIIAGVVVIIIGVVLSAWAAIIKENDLADAVSEDKPSEKKSFVKGVIICLVAGLTGPMLNYAFIYGDQIRILAETQLIIAGRSPRISQTLAPNAIWAIALSSGFIVNISYCLFLVARNKSWALFREKGTGIYYLYTLIMAVLWAGSIAIFGMATANLGELGPSIGWAVFNAIGITWANTLGILTGEWKGVGRKGIIVMTIGLIVLLSGVCLVGWANAL